MKRYSRGRTLRASLLGAVAGGAVGFALGVLLAPQEGQKTQRRLIYKLDHLAGQLGMLVDQVMHSPEESAARRTGDAVVADARDRAKRIREDIDALLVEMRSHEGS